MPILFQSRNIRRLLGMSVTKQAEQEIYLIAQHPPLTLLGSHRSAVMRADTSAHTGEHILTSPPPPSTTLVVIKGLGGPQKIFRFQIGPRHS